PQSARRRLRSSRRTSATPSGGRSARPARRSLHFFFLILREELERLARLRLLLARDLHLLRRKVRAALGGPLERLPRRATGGELEHARTVGVEPHLRDDLALEVLGRERALEDEDRSERRQVVERGAVRHVCRVVRALLLREELPQRAV